MLLSCRWLLNLSEHCRFIFCRNAEIWALAQEGNWVLIDDLMNELGGMTSAAHLLNKMGDGGRKTWAPIAGRGHANAFAAIHFDHIDRTGRRGFGLWIEGQ